MEIVEAAALLHDVADWKYVLDQKGEGACVIIRPILSRESVGWEEHKIERVIAVVQGVSFKNELPSSESSASSPIFPIETAIVQDADRLDAIGAVGIARTFAFSAKKGTPFFDPAIPVRHALTREDYMKPVPSTTINHFHEKLLKLKDMMKTITGRALAQRRHEFMVTYLQEFMFEISQ